LFGKYKFIRKICKIKILKKSNLLR
jgi:hypothetical protein